MRTAQVGYAEHGSGGTYAKATQAEQGHADHTFGLRGRRCSLQKKTTHLEMITLPNHHSSEVSVAHLV